MIIRVEDLGRAVFRQRLLHSAYTKINLQRDRHPPCQDTPCEPVQHCGQVDEPARHEDVGDVHRPDLIGAGDWQLPEQIGINFVSRCRFRRVRLAIEGLDAHALHQRGNVPPPDLEAFLHQPAPQHAAAREGKLHVQLVDPVHQLQIGIRHGARRVIATAPA